MGEVIRFDDRQRAHWYVADARPPLPTSEVHDHRFVDPWPGEWQRIEHDPHGWVALDTDLEFDGPFVWQHYTLTLNGEWLPREIVNRCRRRERFAFGIEGVDLMARGIFPIVGGSSQSYTSTTRHGGLSRHALTLPVVIESDADAFRVDIVDQGRMSDLFNVEAAESL